MAVRILQGAFGDEGRVGLASGGTFPLTVFQQSGVRRARAILRRHGGAILADAVGLGKTYMALAIIEERLRAGHDAVVVIPAALRRSWQRPLRRVEEHAVPVSGGSRAGRGAHRCRLVSHTQLSRGASVRGTDRPRLVVVDEAHRFRNPATRRYGALARLISGSPGSGPSDVLLITATPINNRPDDLYHLVRLFLPDHGLRHSGVASLRGAFEGPDAAAVRTVVRALVVRRTRRMVEERFGDASPPGIDVRFPRRGRPEVERYRDPGIPARVRALDALELSVYGAGAGPLIRLGLLKRLDSSPSALASSLDRLRGFLAAFIDAADGGRLLRPGDRRAAGDADPLQLMLLDVVAEPAPPGLDLSALAASARRDLRLIDRRLSDRGMGRAKERALVALLDRLAGEKVVVFTEYRDTAEALWRALAGRFRTGRVDGSGAWLGQRSAGRRAVVERFAPVANGRDRPSTREGVDVLVATDVLSEGLNLQDARHVVSYDLPWNPVRLLQRIGRVDRLGSRHELVVPHLFVPAEGLDAVLGLTRQLRAKLDGMAGTVGEERADELLESLAAPGSDVVERTLYRGETDAGDPLDRLRTLWVRHGTGEPAAPAADRIWATTRVPAGHPAEELDAVLLVALGGEYRLLELHPDRLRPVGQGAVSAVARALAAPGSDGRPAATPGPQTADGLSPILVRVHDHLRDEAAVARAPAPVRRHSPAARFARRVRAGLSTAGASLDPALVARADALLRVLDAPLAPADAATVAAALENHPMQEASDQGRTLHRLIAETAELLTDREGREPVDGGAEPAVLAILRIDVDQAAE